jgi:hypothetical protein
LLCTKWKDRKCRGEKKKIKKSIKPRKYKKNNQKTKPNQTEKVKKTKPN